ncbi:hypothetical protein L915_05750 [Phytophthora nicotianae]|uniref:Uncharacterized protein n=1 Tax=Phytophthora nicotianae TaxID=4792 RepID=W2H7R8_PHYNI|nr:hypothetical protein L915_05750 [Phytophthora nicotianae]
MEPILVSRSTARRRSRHSRGLHPEGLLNTGSTSYIHRARIRRADVGVPRLEWDWKEGNEEVPRCGPLRANDLRTGNERLGRKVVAQSCFFLLKQEAFGIYQVTFGIIALVLVPTSACYIHDPDTKEEDRDSLVEKQGIFSPGYRGNESAERE